MKARGEPRLLKISCQRVDKIAKTNATFPAPVAILGGIRVWETNVVTKWSTGDREDQVVPRRRSLTSTLYRDARDRGNVGAAKHGRHAPQRRVVHKRVLKTSNGVVQRGLRKVGLWR